MVAINVLAAAALLFIGLCVLSGAVLIGWMLLDGVIALTDEARRMWEHYWTRNVPPAAGQVWSDGQHSREITGVFHTPIGDQVAWRASLPGGYMQWQQTRDAWQSMVRARRMWLVTP